VQIVRSSEELARARSALEGSVALVPTMGALHAGHVALLEEARSRADRTVASIFVNPMQFGENEDFTRYPRSEAKDAELLEKVGCDLLWLPSPRDIYPEGFATRVHVAGVSARWEGESRPGHFDGVSTIVAKLLFSVRPNFAFFGEKDFQQLAVIAKMVEDLNIAVTIVPVTTVRDEDGLALSSRNSYLSEEERSRAIALPRALRYARNAILDDTPVRLALDTGRKSLIEAGFSRIDYFALVDGKSLEPLEAPATGARLIAAAQISGTRLIDNLALENIG
jgi:pantoate--beta-alanine ligase